MFIRRSITDVLMRRAKNSRCLLLTGPRQVGKSTLLKVIAGKLEPDRGEIFIQPGTKVAYMPQDPDFSGFATLRDVVLAGLPADEHGLEYKADILIEQLGILEQQPVASASGGEKRKAALAQALVSEPDILLLDEPTKGLDSFFKRQLAGLLHRLMAEQGVTIVMVSHDVEFCAEYASSVSMFFDGQLLTTNTPRRFFAQNSFYTTAANRMSRHLFPQAVTAEDVVSLMKENDLT